MADDSQSVSVSCGAEKLQAPLESVVKKMDDILTATQNIENSLAYMYEHLTEMADAVIHIHDSHLHFRYHSGEDRYDVGVGAAVQPPTSGFGDRLAAEYNNNADMDGNGLIFGKDFLINQSDPKFPTMLSAVYNIIPLRIKNSLPKFAWQTYLNSLPDKGKGMT